jgi:ferric-dicitrate binding protein FerR (iron transport regulator)
MTKTPPPRLTVGSGPRDDDERMVRYVVGECTPAESAEMREWIAADPARWARFVELERTWRAGGGESSKRWNAERALAKLREVTVARVGAEPATYLPPVGVTRAPYVPRTTAYARYLGGVARVTGALALVAIGAMGWRTLGGRWPVRADGDTGAAVPLQAVTTARGQRATITLPDGSRIVLGAESNVRYARDFGARVRRDVFLRGQAYFEVAHDTLHPFSVHTSAGIAEDLGTEFVVTAYPEAPGMEVVVASGSVRLRAVKPDSATRSGTGIEMRDSSRVPSVTVASGEYAVQPITLGPGELGRVNDGGSLSKTRVTDLSPYLDWTGGELVFRGVPLREALPAISRWYDVQIVLADTSLASRRLVASFGPHSSGRDVVRMLALAINARYEQRGDTIVFIGTRGAEGSAPR